MDINSAYPSQFLKASDLGGKTAKVLIRNVLIETVGNGKDEKPIIYFQGKEKGLVLNRTNANVISMVYGTNTDDWQGGELELFTAMVDFQGRSVEAIRVRVPPRRPNQQRDDWQAPASAGPNSGSVNIAPNARARAEAVPAGAVDFDDPVPF